MDAAATSGGLAPFSLKEAPALIERVFPAQKVGAEAQKERKAGAGQTLTALGSYWKGRKPLVLVRATVLACLLPATDDPEGDLELFEMLMRMDHDGLLRRQPKVTASHVWASDAVPKKEKLDHIEPPWGEDTTDELDADAKAPVTRGGGARWLPIDLSEFDEVEAKAKEEAKLKLIVARATPGTDAARREAVAVAKAEAKAALAEIKAKRDTERERIQGIRHEMMQRTFLAMPFSRQIGICERIEKLEDIQDPEDPLYAGIWGLVNERLGTVAFSIPDLIKQLGVARFGRSPVVGDPFAGGGSIPFEAARIGCDVVASDLNPVAAMLTWGALNIIGADRSTRERIAEEQRQLVSAVDAEITRWGIEHNARGDRAKAYLYCLEVLDPQTGWRVPMAPTWVISRNRRCVARLIPDYTRKRFDIAVEEDVSTQALREAEAGTVRDGHLVYRLAPTPGAEAREWRIAVSRLRGDGEGPEQPNSTRGNRLRPWESTDIIPHEPEWVADARPAMDGTSPGAWVGGDIWLERLYCIQWMDGGDLAKGKTRPRTWFAAPDEADVERELLALRMVQENLTNWQSAGFIPDMRIEPGEKTDEPIRTRGWSYWHHLFGPRHLLILATTKRIAERLAISASWCVMLARALGRLSRLTHWAVGSPGKPGVAPNGDGAAGVFYNQAFNTFFAFAARSFHDLREWFLLDAEESVLVSGRAQIATSEAKEVSHEATFWVYDPPYADAVVYHEITEYFIAWLRRSSPEPLNQWTWDSRRPLAIQGSGERFRGDMVAAFRAMAYHMPDNGLQVCMFTHKDARVWADLAQIVWGAELQVTAAWYVSTETTSELKQGGYVQGTVLMVLRKRVGDEHGFRSDIVPEVRDRVAKQVATLTGLNQKVRGRGRDENVFSDADIQMAGYAAALEVLTAYTHIDGTDMTREALRPRDGRRSAEVGIVEEMIALAVQTANELMVPDGIAEGMWERLSPEERFYLKMTATEATWPAGQLGGKLDDYQNFSRVYRAGDWEDLMAERSPNKARLKGAAEFKRALMTGHPFAAGTIRPTLYAIAEQWRATAQDEDPKTSGDRVLHFLRDHFGLENWRRARDNVRALAAWFGTIWERQRAEEAAAARVVAGLIASERLAG